MLGRPVKGRPATGLSLPEPLPHRASQRSTVTKEVMTGIETSLGGAVVKLAISRAAPAGLKKLIAISSRREVFVVGPEGAGKTTFSLYMTYGILQHAGQTERTYDPVRSPRFHLRLGTDNTLAVSVKASTDIPGQLPARNVADETFRRRPHGVVIMISLESDFDEATEWLEDFFGRLDQQWQTAKPRRNRLKSAIVVLNKLDLVDETTASTAVERFRAQLSHRFSAALPPKADIRVKQAVVVDGQDGAKWVDGVLIDLVSAMTRKH